MRQFILIGLGFILGFVLFSQIKSCGYSETTITDTVHQSDTVWQKYDTIVVKKVKVKEIIHDTLPPQYIPDVMYDSLKVQYEELVQDYLAKKIYSDTLSIPELKGLFVVNDTVKNNELLGRSWSADYTIPIITNTTTITNTTEVSKKGQVYIGGGVATNKDFSNTCNLGILYKTKKDKIVGAYMVVMPGMQIGYGLQTYWKLTFKK